MWASRGLSSNVTLVKPSHKVEADYYGDKYAYNRSSDESGAIIDLKFRI